LLKGYALLLVLEVKVLYFQSINALSMEDEDFKEVGKESHYFWPFHTARWFSLQGQQAFHPQKLFKGLDDEESCGGVGYFSINKTLEILKKHLY